MILIKTANIKRLLKRMAEKAERYNDYEYQPMKDEALWQLGGMRIAAEALGIRASIILSEDGERIAMVKVNGVIERIPH